MARYTSTRARRIVFADGRVVARFVEGEAEVEAGDVRYLDGLEGVSEVKGEKPEAPNAPKASSKRTTKPAEPAPDEKPGDANVPEKPVEGLADVD